MERTIPTNIGNEVPKNERKKEIYKGEHISITYYPDRVVHPKYYLQVLWDKILFPFNLLRYKYGKSTYVSMKKKGGIKWKPTLSWSSEGLVLMIPYNHQ